MPSTAGSGAAGDASIPECRTEGFDLLQRPVWILDTVRMRKHYANAAACALWKVAPGEEAEFFARDFTPHSAAIRARLGLTIARLRAGEIFTERWTFYPKDQPFTVDCLMSPVRLPNGNVGMLVEATLPEVEAAERRSVEALRHTLVMVSLYDAEGRVLFRNPAAARCFPGPDHRFLSGFAEPEKGRAMWERAFEHDPARTDAFMGKTVSGDFRMRTIEGARWHGIDIRTTTDPVSGSVSVLVNQRDITDRVEAHARSDFLATHDTMTGLVNRSRFMELLEAAMRKPGSSGALITLDLDNFKEINDTHGHGAGDAVLREIGVRLRANVRGEDLCARVGGDEFALLLPGLTDPEHLLRRAAAIDLRLSQTIVDPQSDGVFTMAASFGIACWPQDGGTPDALQRNADLALYAAKGETGRRIRRFDVELRRAADLRHQRIEDLRLALANDEFEVFFQPLVELASRRAIGFETLLRWRHPTRGLQMPDSFIPAAESVGMMTPIGRIVLAKACAQVRGWLDEGLAPGPIAVNLSANQFRDGRLAERIAETVREAGLEPAQVEFEVPETVTLGRRGEMVRETLASLRQSGFGIVLDDFGTGHASLTHLQRLPIDMIKIDRSFIADMERSAADRAIVHVVVALGRELGMRVLAEGVETEGQRAMLTAIGCRFGQGFLFGRPMDGRKATAWLRQAQGLAPPRPPDGVNVPAGPSPSA